MRLGAIALEVVEVVLDSGMRGVGLDVDVPGDGVRVERSDLVSGRAHDGIGQGRGGGGLDLG